MTTRKAKKIKEQKLRNNEYYDIQAMQDDLYHKSRNGCIFDNLMPLIMNRTAILLAFRNIKNNKGSKTKGTNNATIEDIKTMGEDKLVEYVRSRLLNFTPHSVRRKEIPKPNGKMRPLGIPTIEDRIIGQCIKQILEPITEAKFYKHSYGFRPNRSTEHAIARAFNLATVAKLHYVVDIDIKGFFDNVDHGKLLKQMWSLGIRDKSLLCIISKMLKAEIEGMGKQQKGVPQGGILSPLLSGIVLNELDWWIANQWENMKTSFDFKAHPYKINALKRTNLKEMYIVRYADDFKIFCRNAKDAQKIFVATKNWLKERLNLEISPEKSKVVNLRKNYSDFLGFKLKVKPKRKGFVMKSHISDKAQQRIVQILRAKIKIMIKSPSAKNCDNYNSTILGIHNYYKIASNCNIDFNRIGFLVRKSLIYGTRKIRSSTGIKTKAYEKFYGEFNYKIIYVAKTALYPIAGVKTRKSQSFSPKICQYTLEGRKYIHENLPMSISRVTQYLLKNPVINESVEFNDNRISLFAGQQGKCYITGKSLNPTNMIIHRRVPKRNGGDDSYSNLIFVTQDAANLINEKDEVKAKNLAYKLKLDSTRLKRVNKFRKLVGNCMI